MRHVAPLSVKESKTAPSETDQPLRLGAVAAAFALCAVITLLFAAFYQHKIARMDAQRAEAIAAGHDNRAFCASLGLAPASALYRRCEEDAAQRRQDQRLAKEAAGAL